jgi:hypothetical protein
MRFEEIDWQIVEQKGLYVAGQKVVFLQLEMSATLLSLTYKSYKLEEIRDIRYN